MSPGHPNIRIALGPKQGQFSMVPWLSRFGASKRQRSNVVLNTAEVTQSLFLFCATLRLNCEQSCVLFLEWHTKNTAAWEPKGYINHQLTREARNYSQNLTLANRARSHVEPRALGRPSDADSRVSGFSLCLAAGKCYGSQDSVVWSANKAYWINDNN